MAYVNTLDKDAYGICELHLQACAPSDDTDQPARARSLIRVFTGQFLDSQ